MSQQTQTGESFLFTKLGASSTYEITPSMACISSELHLAHNAYVTCVKWYKKTTAPYHEFLVVYVTKHPTSSRKKPLTTAIIIDRNVAGVQKHQGDTTGEPMDLIFEVDGQTVDAETLSKKEKDVVLPLAPATKTRASFASSMESLSSSSSSSLPPTILAGDKMHFSHDGTDGFLEYDKWVNSELCHVVEINGDYLTVLQVAVLARAVHDHHRSYTLREFQCYWYADVIYNTIKKIVSNAAGSNSRSPPFSEIHCPHSMEVGHFLMVPIGSLVKSRWRGSKTYDQVYKKYQEGWKRMEGVVKELKEQKHVDSLEVSVVIVL